MGAWVSGCWSGTVVWQGTHPKARFCHQRRLTLGVHRLEMVCPLPTTSLCLGPRLGVGGGPAEATSRGPSEGDIEPGLSRGVGASDPIVSAMFSLTISSPGCRHCTQFSTVGSQRQGTSFHICHPKGLFQSGSEGALA